MGYTLKQLAEHSGVSKQTAWRYVKRENIDPIEELNNGAQVYPEDTLQKIVQEYQEDITSGQGYNSASVIELLQKQLEQQQQIIENDRQQMEKMQQALDQQQRLQLSTNRLLENRTNKNHTEPQDDTTDNNSDNSTQTQKEPTEGTQSAHVDDRKGLFSRLFGKK